MLRGEENPPALFPHADIKLMRGTWWVAHTKPRQEKALARDLARSDAGYFLPMCDVKRTSRGRSWPTRLPLFPGYVFLCGSDADRLASLKTGRVIATIPVPDQQGLLAELAAVQRLIESGLGVDPYPALKRGVRCRVRSGPLHGLEGKVAQRRDRSRFVIEVSILGQGAAVTIDGALLEPVD